ncbi:Putative uncharacterized protein [Taphrina deformans PYCC 5710]|uniref:Fe2OG dioxygenase domain-containing protein n=1 Tax=Taphrina deformans (strain PYCC 5710 / ATCC 11124 / CBS 356.35 / IMI 108563 / JCM 9778 / NBRC 8474) TaxID=1097556 RepID=R4XHM4_TAPDE|nr:Putative uncharacterized protein [Taphrina deformans PYCC 5710]|eukprot:CCG82917.1 Putative uncharacterized protein [Taphrina deformans PYCC 5710]
MALELFRVDPRFEVYYIPSFLNAQEQSSMTEKIYALDRKWVQLKNRRVQAHPNSLLGGTTLAKAPLPDFLTRTVFDKFETLGIFRNTAHRRANHVLVNEYRPGQGIPPHEDGDVYFPLVATLTLGSHCVYHLYSKDQPRQILASILQEPGSCLVTCGATYSKYLHGIDEVQEDADLSADNILNWDFLSEEYQVPKLTRGTRLSLTYREVNKVKNFMALSRDMR